MEFVRQGLNYQFKNAELFHKALNWNSSEHSLWAKKGDLLLKNTITELVQARGKSDHIRQIVETNDLYGSIVVAIGLANCIGVDRQLEKDRKRLIDYYEDLKSVRQFSKAFYIPCYYSGPENRCVEAVFVPKTFGDVFEALVYAIYLDCGGDENKQKWEPIFEGILSPIIDYLVERDVRQPTSRVNETTNGTFLKEIKFKQADQLLFRVFDKNDNEIGRGRSQELAKRAAAISKLKTDGGYHWPWAINP